MRIKDYKCNCGHNDFFFADKGNQKGIYCSYCGKWLKWADKDEQNLTMKQEPVLDKIRAEIEDKISAYDDRNISEYKDCLEIINKYTAEKEDKK